MNTKIMEKGGVQALFFLIVNLCLKCSYVARLPLMNITHISAAIELTLPTIKRSVMLDVVSKICNYNQIICFLRFMLCTAYLSP
ncbi:hypothetical protein ACJX0J_005581, partial [Zea mays]